MRSVLTKTDGMEHVAFDRSVVNKRCEHDPEAVKFLQSIPNLAEAFAAATKAISNNVQGSLMSSSFIEEETPEVMVTITVDNPSVELNQRIQKLVRDSHRHSDELLEYVTFSL